MPCEHEHAAIRAAHCPVRQERHVAGRSDGRMLTDAEARVICRNSRQQRADTGGFGNHQLLQTTRTSEP